MFWVKKYLNNMFIEKSLTLIFPMVLLPLWNTNYFEEQKKFTLSLFAGNYNFVDKMEKTKKTKLTKF